MNRIDGLVIWRLGTRIAVTVFIFYGIIAVAESLDIWRFNHVSDEYGLHMALVMVAMSAMRWSIKTLPVTVLLGAMLGLADLRMRHELTVIKASGISIWRVLRAPIIALLLVSLVISLGAETAATRIMRDLAPTPLGQVTQLTPDDEIWLEQRGGHDRYVLMARNMAPGGTTLSSVTMFSLTESEFPRIEAEEARLENGHWVMDLATVRSAGSFARQIEDLRIPTASTPAEIRLRLESTEDMTFFELASLVQRGVSDPAIRAATTMRLIKLLALPLVLTGSLIIAFSMATGYSRNSQLGRSVISGVILGFVVFVTTEIADRAGSSGVIDPLFAAIAPAIIAIMIGVTVLLHREDGWI
jgi:lipopolysaccharide export system permease protein